MWSDRSRRAFSRSLRLVLLIVALAVAAGWYSSFSQAAYTRVGAHVFALGFGTVDWWHEYDVPEYDLGMLAPGTIKFLPADAIVRFPGRIPLGAVWGGALAALFLGPLTRRFTKRISPATGRMATIVGGTVLALSAAAWVTTQFRIIHVRTPVVGVCGYIGSAWVAFSDRSAAIGSYWGAGMMPTAYFSRSCSSCESAYLGHKTGGYPNRQMNFLWTALAGMGVFALGRGVRTGLERQGLCPHCGYCRTGDSSARCPECGSTHRPQV